MLKSKMDGLVWRTLGIRCWKRTGICKRSVLYIQRASTWLAIRRRVSSLVAKTAYQLFYSSVGQQTSVGNYWNDPHHQDLYEQFSIFLPYVNNRLYSTNSTQFRETVMRLRWLVLIGGPDDGVITPWQSSHFSFYNETNEVVPLQESPIYKEDLIGLKTLNDSGRLDVISRDGVHHYQWHRTDHVIDSVIIPYLD